MKVEIFCLCDFAQSANDGKLNILGIFDAVYAGELPFVQGLFAVAIKLALDSSELGQKNFAISFMDSGKIPMAPDIESVISIAPIPSGGQSAVQRIQLVVLIPQILLPQLGEYSVVLAVDGQPVASTPLYLRPNGELLSRLQKPPQTV